MKFRSIELKGTDGYVYFAILPKNCELPDGNEDCDIRVGFLDGNLTVETPQGELITMERR